MSLKNKPAKGATSAKSTVKNLSNKMTVESARKLIEEANTKKLQEASVILQEAVDKIKTLGVKLTIVNQIVNGNTIKNDIALSID